MIHLEDIAQYVSDKIDVSNLNASDYVTTDTMLPNRGGVVSCKDLPNTNRVTKFVYGDILVSNIRPYFKKIWFANKSGGCSNDVIVLRTIFEEIDKRFLYYVLAQDVFFDYMMTDANGTKMPRGNKKSILQFIVPSFNVSKQKKIVYILSAYDSLIENNQKQIKLLEEAAQRLYKEWFVDLRFPGHENVKIVDGVPEGWENSKLEELALIKAGGDRPSVFSLLRNKECMIPVFANGTDDEGLYGFTDEAVITEKSITISARGNIGYTCLRRVPFVPIVRLICIIPPEEILEYLFFSIKNNSIQGNGAAQQQLTIPMIKVLEVMLPEYNILSDFNKKVKVFIDKIDSLKNSIIMLQEARDRLLPKLVSGEIEV